MNNFLPLNHNLGVMQVFLPLNHNLGVMQVLNTIILNDEYIRNIIKEANKIYKNFNLDIDIIPVALDIIIRYIKKTIPSEPREKNVLYLAAYYIVKRHPFAYPSYITRESFSIPFDIKTTSLDWYVNRILSDLNFIRIHDSQMKPYFIDRASLIFTVTHSIARSQLSEFLINAVINKKMHDVNIIVDDIVAILLDRLKILPEIFRRSVRTIVMDMTRAEIKDLKL